MNDISSLKKRNLDNELLITATRSSGPGGQHVNKVSTRVELRFNIMNSSTLKPAEKELLISKYGRKLTKDGDLIIVAQEERSQLDNRERALEKFYNMISKGLVIPRKRKPTKPTATSRLKRLESKTRQANKKSLRKSNFDE